MKPKRVAWAKPASAPFNRIARHLRIVGDLSNLTLCEIPTSAKTEFGDVVTLNPDACRECAKRYKALRQREAYAETMAAAALERREGE